MNRWAIRNCGLILIRSLIDCIFGTNESKSSMEIGWDGETTRIPWHKYEGLPDVLVKLLKMGQTPSTGLLGEGKDTAQAIFPALDIIRRAGPPEGYMDELYDAVAWYLGSNLWHVREMAARALCSFLKPSIIQLAV